MLIQNALFLLIALFSISLVRTWLTLALLTFQVRSPILSYSFITFFLGLFVGGDEESDMQLVKNLAIDYIKKPSCIILLTVACESTSRFQHRASY
jgi:hypothetical protein